LEDQDLLANLFEEHKTLKGKISQAEAKRKQSKDGKERLRLKRQAEAWEEEALALEVEIIEVSGRIQEGEREKAIERAEALREEAQKILEAGIAKRKWVLGYLRTLWKAHAEIWSMRQQFRLTRDSYYQACREHGIEAKAITHQGFEDIQRFNGRVLPNAQDSLHRGANFLTWLEDMMNYGRGRISSVATPPKKDLWPE